MELGTRRKRYAFITSLILIVLLSFSVAVLTYRYYSFIVRGILGIVFLYLLFFGNGLTKNDVSFKTVLADPHKGKYLIYAFIDPLLAYWATGQIFEMIFFLRR